LFGRSLFFVLAISSIALADPEAEPEVTERPPHPEPRVIVTVHSVRGPHKSPEVERAARLGWGRIVRCYKKDGKRERGKIDLAVTVSGSGTIAASRTRHSSFRGRELPSCVSRALRGLSMPKARRGSDARIEIQLSPGDLAASEDDQ
jgi:hypothetical protein